MSGPIKAQLPNGVTLEFPAGTADEIIDSTVQSMIKQQIGASAQPARATTMQKVTSSVPGRVLQGMRDPIDAGAQILPRALKEVFSLGGLADNRVSDFFGSEAKRVDQGIQSQEQAYQQARKATGQSGFDAARLAGGIISPANAAIASRIPMAATTALGRARQGAIAGAASGMLQPVTNTENFGSEKALQVGAGTLFGAAVSPVVGFGVDKISNISRSLSTKNQPVYSHQVEKFVADYADSIGVDVKSLSSDVLQELKKQATKAMQQYKGRDLAAAMRMMDFTAEGMQPLQGQITRDPTQWAAELNLRQTPAGQQIMQRLNEQNAALQQRFGGFAKGATEDQIAGGSLTKALREYDKKLQAGVTERYSAARAAAGKDMEVPLGGLANDFALVVENYGDKVPSGVRNNFAKYGLGNSADGTTQTKVFNVEEADRLLKVINSNTSNDPATNSALNELRRAVKRAITQDAGVDDVFAPARKAAKNRFDLQDAIPALAAASEGANPDTFVQNYLISKTSTTPQVKELARVLKEQSPEAYTLARAQIGQYIQRKAFGENPAADATISPNRLATALRELGSGKLSAFFDPQELAQINRLARISAYKEARPANAIPNTSGNFGAITGVASRIGGLSQTAAIANALRNVVGNETAAMRALTPQVPKVAATLTPQDVRRLSQFTAAAGSAGGIIGANELKD